VPGLTAVRPPLAAFNRVILALAFLPPVFLVTTSPDVMTVVPAARRVTPEVFAAIAVVVVLVVLSRRLTVTGLTMTHSLAGRAPGRLRAAGAAAGVLGPLSVIAAGWLDLAALLALIGAPTVRVVSMLSPVRRRRSPRIRSARGWPHIRGSCSTSSIDWRLRQSGRRRVVPCSTVEQ
jgi:hypothetical protein